MSIFNATAPGGGGGGGGFKVATMTTSPGYSTVQSISFSVSAQPSEFALVCIAPSSTAYCTLGSSYYGIVDVYSPDGSNKEATYCRGSSSSVRYYKTTSYPTITYSNGALTLAGNSTYVFPAADGNFSTGFTYYLFYR